MNVSDEAIWALISAIVTGVVLRIVGWWAERNQQTSIDTEIRNNTFQTSIQAELEDIRDENKKYKEESDHYREAYFEALERLHDGGSVKDVTEALLRIEGQTGVTKELLAQHLRDGVYLLEQGIEHDQQVIEAFAQIGIVIADTEYQKDKALGAQQILDRLDKLENQDQTKE